MVFPEYINVLSAAALQVQELVSPANGKVTAQARVVVSISVFENIIFITNSRSIDKLISCGATIVTINTESPVEESE
jgi:hypothetical protein